MGNAKYRLRTYTNRGNIDRDIYSDDLYKLLQQYTEIRTLPPNPQNPTIWIYEGTGYVRVHDFMFHELNQDTYRKYLKERILDSDNLLEKVLTPEH